MCKKLTLRSAAFQPQLSALRRRLAAPRSLPPLAPPPRLARRTLSPRPLLPPPLVRALSGVKSPSSDRSPRSPRTSCRTRDSSGARRTPSSCKEYPLVDGRTRSNWILRVPFRSPTPPGLATRVHYRSEELVSTPLSVSPDLPLFRRALLILSHCADS